MSCNENAIEQCTEESHETECLSHSSSVNVQHAITSYTVSSIAFADDHSIHQGSGDSAV